MNIVHSGNIFKTDTCHTEITSRVTGFSDKHTLHANIRLSFVNCTHNLASKTYRLPIVGGALILLDLSFSGITKLLVSSTGTEKKAFD